MGKKGSSPSVSSPTATAPSPAQSTSSLLAAVRAGVVRTTLDRPDDHMSIAARHLQHVRAIISAVHAVASSTEKARRLGNEPARATTMRRGYWNGIHASERANGFE
jgi:hypothetical protein